MRNEQHKQFSGKNSLPSEVLYGLGMGRVNWENSERAGLYLSILTENICKDHSLKSKMTSLLKLIGQCEFIQGKYKYILIKATGKDTAYIALSGSPSLHSGIFSSFISKIKKLPVVRNLHTKKGA